MAKTYDYLARDYNGQLITGHIIAENRPAVAAFLRDQGLYITRIKEKKNKAFFLEYIWHFHRITAKQLSLICKQFATMLSAGISILTCLNILIEQTQNHRLRQVFEDILVQVEEGHALSQALERHPDVFPNLMVSMVRVGEVSGTMDQILERLSTQFEKEYKLREKLTTALTYPMLVLIIAAMTLVFILTFVLPSFLVLYEEMQLQLPLPTRILLAVSNWICSHYLVLLAVNLQLVYAIWLIYRNEHGKRYVEKLISKIPGVGMLLREAGIARFSRTLATLVKGGVPIIEALEAAKHVTGQIVMMDALTKAQESLRQGSGLVLPLTDSKIFTPLVIQMIAIGEETGELDQMLEKIADFYENEVEDFVSRCSSMLEPVVMCLLGVVIGSMIIAVILPLFDMVTNIQRQV